MQFGPNELRRRGGARWPHEIARQLTHPLALLLWVAALLSFGVGNQAVGIAVLLVIVLNAAFAFMQELQAERAVETLAAYMPQHVTVLRDRAVTVGEAVGLVPGDVDATLTRLAARDLVFSGTVCTGGEAHAVVFATGMHTELGRIAALSERVKEEPSPLERQVRRVAWLIAAVAVALAIAFVPIAIIGAGLSLRNSVVFSVGLLAGNVPEGLLPVITLALAVAVSLLARRGALVRRLSAVETLGSTDVICTDKTGTLTENRMRPVEVWTLSGIVTLAHECRSEPATPGLRALAQAAADCNNARLGPDGGATGDPTEIALLRAAQALRADIDAERREVRRRHQYNFDPKLKLMSTLEREDG